MKRAAKWITACLVVCLGLGGTVSAYDGNDADYSAALLAIMGQGEVPEEKSLSYLMAENVQEIQTDKMCYTTDVLSVRACPGTEYEQLSQLAQFTRIRVVGVCSNGWSHVVMENGLEGYVSNEFLSEQVPKGAERIGESLGLFTVTYYCACDICCGWWSGGPTASGAYPTADWTIAADPDVLPLGTCVYINGHEYCVEDTGSGVIGNHVDIYVTNHDLAVNYGVGSAEIFKALPE